VVDGPEPVTVCGVMGPATWNGLITKLFGSSWCRGACLTDAVAIEVAQIQLLFQKKGTCIKSLFAQNNC